MNDNKKGLLICFEGLDGSGKTTQIELCNHWLQELNYQTLITYEPTDLYKTHYLVVEWLSKPGKTNKKIVKILSLLSAADRLYHIDTVIQPALKEGTIVLCHRYVYSSYAYHVAWGVDLGWLRNLNRHILMPDLCFLLQAPVGEIISRNIKRGYCREYEKDEIFSEKVNNVFQMLTNSRKEIKIIKAEGPIDQVQLKIRSILQESLRKAATKHGIVFL